MGAAKTTQKNLVVKMSVLVPLSKHCVKVTHDRVRFCVTTTETFVVVD